ncbi:unnamed protein product [Orchesella dallaii]|uniref:F-box domain-containing protein n=1 Tax=Orchesella dallaii TaxID=48710 RepID=A0ABP1PST0_9HEXA
MELDQVGVQTVVEDDDKTQIPFLPVEMLTEILSYITSDGRKDLLNCRLVNKQWKSVTDKCTESRFVAGPIGPFPELCKCKIQSRLQDVDNVTDIIPFNGLSVAAVYRICKSNPRCNEEEDSRIISLVPGLLRQVGAHLTSFALASLKFDFLDMPALLNLTPLLKLLKLSNLSITTNMTTLELELPALPELPNFVQLHFSGDYAKYLDPEGISNLLYTWVVISYSDQIVSLKMETREAMPPLSPSRDYIMTVAERVFIIGRTSNIAFAKLDDLKIDLPSREFLLHSITPKLKRLTIYYLNEKSPPDITHVAKFIDSNANTLEKISLDIPWDAMVGDIVSLPQFIEESMHPTSKVILPHVTLLNMHYPSPKDMKILATTILVKFPALCTLSLREFNDENPPNMTVEQYFSGVSELSPPLWVLDEAWLEREVLLSSFHHFVSSMFPDLTMQEAVVMKMSKELKFWDTCKKLQRITFTLDAPNPRFVIARASTAAD